MTTRIGQRVAPFKRTAPTRRRRDFPRFDDPPKRDLALAYSNGFVTVEISQDALDAYIDMTGDVPLPIVHDGETGDRRVYDARNRVRVVYDPQARVREVATRSNDGLFVRINFTDASATHR